MERAPTTGRFETIMPIQGGTVTPAGSLGDSIQSRSGESLVTMALPAGGRNGWRIRERVRTVSAGLVLCLHLGVDPPDVHKTVPVARLECWTEPEEGKARETIARNLAQQYEFWQPRGRYKSLLDPTAEELRKLCQTLRRGAKEERVLLHYNGHGVPRPTRGGELWVFNRQYTQYIPISVSDVAIWVGTPLLAVIDSSAAGNVYSVLRRLGETGADVLVLAACGGEEVLPMAPEMPADIFTACLTTPMEIAIRWHVYRASPLMPAVSLETAMGIPGRLSDRRTPLGELNWILTAITDTIAWTILPRDLFKRLFRQDVLVASLFRNFLLAMRILKGFRCNALSWPPIPMAAVVSHEMWQAWDHALDCCLAQRAEQAAYENANTLKGENFRLLEDTFTLYEPSGFFAGQMDAFELWITQKASSSIEIESGGEAAGTTTPATSVHLPIVLQVLLSQSHRNRALNLLGAFVDLGDWAILDALHVGVFPYILKLFQSPAPDIRYALLYLWLRILQFDGEVGFDLRKDDAYLYLVKILIEPTEDSIDSPQIKCMAAIGLCLFCITNHSHGLLLTSGQITLLGALIEYSSDPMPLLVEWVIHLLAIMLLFLGKEYQSGMITTTDKVRLEDASSPPPLPIEGAESNVLESYNTSLNGNNTVNLTTAVTATKLSSSISNSYNHSTFNKKTGGSPGPSGSSTFALVSMVVSALETKFFKVLKHERCENRVATVHMLGCLLALSGLPEEIECEIVYKLLECVDDCHPPVRQELVVALSRFISRQTPRFILTAYAVWESHNGNVTNNEHVMVAPGAGDIVRHPGVCTLIWKTCLVLAIDPFEAVANCAARLVDEIQMGFMFKSSMENDAIFLGGNSDGEGRGTTATKKSFYSNLGDDSQVVVFAPPKSVENVHAQNALVLCSAIPLESDIITRSATIFIEDQRRQRQLNQRKSKDPVQAALTKVQLVDADSQRIWNSLSIANRKFDQQIGVLTGDNPITAVLFHPLNDRLVAADSRGQVAIWDYSSEEPHLTNLFSNGLQAVNLQSNITGLACVDWNPVKLLVGTSDGIIRLYESFEDGPETVRAAWSIGIPNNSNNNRRGLMSSVSPVNRVKEEGGEVTTTTTTINNGRLLLEWNQSQRRLYTTSHGTDLAILDATSEQIIQRVSLEPGTVSAMTSDRREYPIVTLGFSDGWIRWYDLRQSPKEAVASVKGHESMVIGVKETSEYELVSGGMIGDIRRWDMRTTRVIMNMDVGRAGATALDVHSSTNLVAVSTSDQSVRIFTNDGNSIANLKYHDGFLAQRLGPIAALAFHPRRLMLSIGSTDGIVSLFSARL